MPLDILVHDRLEESTTKQLIDLIHCDHMLLDEQIQRFEEGEISHHLHTLGFLERLLDHEPTVLIELIFNIEESLGYAPDLLMLEALIEIVQELTFSCLALLVYLIIDRKTAEYRNGGRDHGRVYGIEEYR